MSIGEIEEVNEGGYPVKNASYWRRRCIKLELENAELEEAVLELNEVFDAAVNTLNSNKYLTDGDSCTLFELREAVEKLDLFWEDSYGKPL